jgi:large conductance mechanosensitive channel
MGMVNDFKAFILRGNVVDLAVAVVIGAAFGAVVLSLVSDLLTPLIGAIFGESDFSGLTFTINDSTFYYGNFINKVFTFLTVAAAVFFFVVVPVNALMARSHREPPPDPSIKKCPECLSDIAAEARRCAFCTAQLSAA